MVTASSIAARASSRRPRSDRRLDWLFSAWARSGRNASGRACGELAADGDGFLDRGQGLLPPPQLRQASRLVVQRHGEVGQERVGAGLRRAGGRCVTASSIAARASSRRPSSDRQARLVVQRRGEVGQERVGAGLGELAVDADGFLDRGQGLLPPPQVADAVAEINQPAGALAVIRRFVSQSLEYKGGRRSKR